MKATRDIQRCFWCKTRLQRRVDFRGWCPVCERERLTAELSPNQIETLRAVRTASGYWKSGLEWRAIETLARIDVAISRLAPGRLNVNAALRVLLRLGFVEQTEDPPSYAITDDGWEVLIDIRHFEDKELGR